MEAGYRNKKWDAIFGLSLFVACLIIYVFTLAPTLYFGDSAELATAAYNLGIAHPPGYPLYLLLGKLFITAIPFGDVAFRMNLLSAFFAAFASVIIYFLMRLLIGDFFVAVLTSIIASFSYSFWCEALVAEVYTFFVWFWAVLIFLTLKWLKTKNSQSLWLLFFIGGLALTHHISIIIYYPVIFIFAFLNKKHLALPKKWWFKGGILMILPLLLYAYLPIRSAQNPPNDWGNPETFSAIFDHISAKIYQGKIFEYGFWGLGTQLKKFFYYLTHQLYFILVILAIAGLILALKNHKRIAFFLLALACVNIIFASIYFIMDIEPYFIPTFFVMAIFIGFALDFIVQQTKKIQKYFIKKLAFSLLVFLALLPLLLNWSKADRSSNRFARHYGENMLNSLENDGILICRGDNELHITAYLTIVEGLRPDLTVYSENQHILPFPLFQNIERYQKIKRSGIAAFMTDLVFKSTRPVYFTYMVDESFPLVEYGVVYRVWHAGEDINKLEIPWQNFDWIDLSNPAILADDMNKMTAGRCLVFRAAFLWRKGNGQAADYFLNKALQIGKDQPMVLDMSGIFLMKTQRYDQASSIFNKLLQMNPFQPDCYNKLGIIAYYQKDFKTAIQNYNQSLKLEKNNFLAFYNRAITFEKWGDQEYTPALKKNLYHKAWQDYYTAQQLEPASPYIPTSLQRLSSKIAPEH